MAVYDSLPAPLSASEQFRHLIHTFHTHPETKPADASELYHGTQSLRQIPRIPSDILDPALVSVLHPEQISNPYAGISERISTIEVIPPQAEEIVLQNIRQAREENPDYTLPVVGYVSFLRDVYFGQKQSETDLQPLAWASMRTIYGVSIDLNSLDEIMYSVNKTTNRKWWSKSEPIMHQDAIEKEIKVFDPELTVVTQYMLDALVEVDTQGLDLLSTETILSRLKRA